MSISVSESGLATVTEPRFEKTNVRDITYAQCTYSHLFTGRISKLGLHSLQSYGCVRITSWITLVENISKSYSKFSDQTTNIYHVEKV